MSLVIVGSFFWPVLAGAAEPVREKPPAPNAFWTKACEFAKVPVDKIGDPSGDYWAGLGASQGSDALLTAAAPVETRDEVIKQYVAGYGRYGYRADIFAALSVPGIFYGGARLPPETKVFPAEYFDIRAKVLEEMVRRAAKDRSFRARGYHLAVWFGSPLNVDSWGPSTLAKQTLKDWTVTEGRNYWWWARNFVLLAHATSRDDMLDSAKPEDLRPVFLQWCEWYYAADRRFVPVPDEYRWVEAGDTDRKVGDERVWLEMPRPKYPLPDWDPSCPIPAKEFFQFYLNINGLREAVKKTKK